ncbi:MAG: ABC transporter permease [Ignavibacteria bacterium]|nr:ABC transporter permease [Ignavibacteria bacterium]
MLANYFKIAFRNLWRQRGYAALNIIGLAVGMACCLLMILYVQHELSFDRFHVNADHIYRLNLSAKMGEMDEVVGGTPPPLGERLRQDFPEVERATRIFPLRSTLVQYENNIFNEPNVLATDEYFLQMFSFKLLEGSSNLALKDPKTAVITKSTAEKYFGTASAIGKTLLLGNEKREFKVIGVVENPPSNAHFSFGILTSLSSYYVVTNVFDWSWVWCQLVTYVQLREGASATALEAKFPQMVEKYAPAAFERIGQSFAEVKKQGGHWDFSLLPLTAIHLHSDRVENPLGETGSIVYVYMFSAVAVLIIVLACINFMNLATARAARRSKEVGIRKSLGVSRKYLVAQFLAESLLASVLAAVCALCLIELFLQPFNTLSGKALRLDFMGNPLLTVSILALTVLVGFAAGLYPALYLSSVKPVDVLAGKLRLGVRSAGLRNGLVVFQFATSVMLIASTILVYSQMDFVRTMNVGFDRENVIVIGNANRLGQKAESFKQSLLAQSSIAKVSYSTTIPGRGSFVDFYKPEAAPLKDLTLSSYLADEDLVPTLGMKIIKGSNFSKENLADCQSGVLLNEEAAKKIGWSDPIGQYITYPGGNNSKFKVIGILKDFNSESLRTAIAPFAVFHEASKTYSIRSSCVVVRVRAGQTRAAVEILERQWKQFTGDSALDYTFLDEDFDRQYRSEQRLGQVLGVFTAIAIVIACLGLFGLAAYIAEQRTKEIGIRKVLGASVGSIIGLLSRDFLKLVAIAIVVAVPLAWYGMNRWLQDFAYRVNITAWMFLLAGGLALVIAFATVAGQAWRAARANPVNALRSE